MTVEYYIIAGENHNGPYDLLMLVRKIRNGSLTADKLVKKDSMDVIKPAGEWQELAEFFSEAKEEWGDTRKQREKYYLSAALKNGIHFFQQNYISSLFSGILILIVFLMIGFVYLTVPHKVSILGYLLSFVLAHFLLSCYMFLILRMIRGQPVEIGYLRRKIFPVIKDLLLSSFFVTLPLLLGLALLISAQTVEISVLGLLIITIPGLFVLTLFAFAPLLIIDQGYNFIDAIKLSSKTILDSGIENIGIIFALLVINFIAGLAILLPMTVTLPVTTSALCEDYDELFS